MSQQSTNIKGVAIANRQLIPQIVAMLNEGHTVTLKLYGYSMRPFLEDGRDKALLRQATAIATGDVALAEILPGKYALHRIIDIEGDNITLRGDGNLNVERCKRKDVYGVAEGFYRKGRETLDSVHGSKWRIYSWIWTRLFPIRRYLLFIYRIYLKAKK